MFVLWDCIFLKGEMSIPEKLYEKKSQLFSNKYIWKLNI